ncbi:MAG: ACP S-malonyltransferase [Saprospirales bacterium]|nr:ACP S-malonyltransferase [Saprospirales bacterium]MBK7337067.1 ACP S-malonyltransferase [Saprospirales bacterium]
MKAYVFPGQGAQFEGMGKDMYENSSLARDLFEQANEILGFRISDVMFEGNAEDLKQTRVTQPAVFLHSVIKAAMAGAEFQPAAVAGHSLGEFSALVANKTLTFENGLRLVYQRAMAMQKACEMQESTMAAVLGLDDALVEQVCREIDDVVVPANYNCPGQLVISGTVPGVEKAVSRLQDLGASKAIILQVGGAFHSPLMQPAKEELEAAIAAATFGDPSCPIYQNVDANPTSDPVQIRKNLIDQLTAPVRWTQTMLHMIGDGVTEIIEVGGTGKVLRGFVARVDRRFPTSAL